MNTEGNSDPFDVFIGELLDDKNDKLEVLGSEYLTDIQKEKVNLFLSSEYGQTRMQKFFEGKERIEIGVVIMVEDIKNSVSKNVSYLNEDGGRSGFGFSPKIHPEAPNGYKVGDVIFIQYEPRAQAPREVKPVRLSPKETLAIINKINNRG